MICADPIARGTMAGRPATGTRAGYKRHWKLGESACPACLAAWREAGATWSAANAESRKRTKSKRRSQNAADAKRRRLAKGDHVRALRRAAHRRNPTPQRERNRRWRQENPQRKRYHDHLRRARQARVLTVPFTDEQVAAKVRYWGDRCWMCHGPFEELDHVIAIARGGPHCIANLRPACKSCNSGKKDRDWRLGMFLDVVDTREVIR